MMRQLENSKPQQRNKPNFAMQKQKDFDFMANKITLPIDFDIMRMEI